MPSDTQLEQPEDPRERFRRLRAESEGKEQVPDGQNSYEPDFGSKQGTQKNTTAAEANEFEDTRPIPVIVGNKPVDPSATTVNLPQSGIKKEAGSSVKSGSATSQSSSQTRSTQAQPTRSQSAPTRSSTKGVVPKRSTPAVSDTRPIRVVKKDSTKPVSRAEKQADIRKMAGCFFRGAVLFSFVIAATAICLVSFLFYEYYRIASTLPDINDLRGRASQFETTRILDRNGNTLYEIIDPNAGRRTYVPMERISPYLVAATIATEDKEFYKHPGVDFFAIIRAFWQNYQGGGTISGASTITQQISKTLVFTPEEISEISYQRKIREAILATEITRKYSKDELLELYLNEIYYGNLAYGIEAAAETYFGTSADALSLGQAAFLAGLPQAPAIYDIHTNPDLTLKRFEDVLVLMYQTSREESCIFVSNSEERICIDPVSVTRAADEIRNYTFESPNIVIRHPHWVTYIRAQLESQIDPQTIYRLGLNVYTTLDPEIQRLAENAVRDQVDNLRSLNVNNGAVVAIRPGTGEILAMVGSADFNNEAISGQVNMAISPRQPGSAIKPLTYIAAFEKGWNPATILWDVPTEFSPSGRADDPSPRYVPNNYTGKTYGPVSVRTALANSLNISAVKVLEFVGIYDNPETEQPDGLLEIAKRVGIDTFNRPDYGLKSHPGRRGGDPTRSDQFLFDTGKQREISPARGNIQDRGP